MDVTVDVRRVRVDAKIARGCALEQEKRRRAEFRCHCVTLVAPRRKEPLARERACDVSERCRASGGIAASGSEAQLSATLVEDVAELAEPRGARRVEPADRSAIDDERAMTVRRRHKRCGQTRDNRG